MKFRLIKDFLLNTGFGEEIILEKGDIIEPNDEGLYIFPKLNRPYTKDELLSKPELFELLKDIKLDITEITETDQDKIGNWRIQLDVKTSRRKLNEIEKFLRETINEML
jgi:hypothetical protein